MSTDDADRRRYIVETMCSVPRHIAIAALKGVLAWNGVGAFLTATAPLLVLRSKPGGSNDPARLLSLRPDVKIGMTFGSGHFHQLEVPEQVNPMIERFLRIATLTDRNDAQPPHAVLYRSHYGNRRWRHMDQRIASDATRAAKL